MKKELSFVDHTNRVYFAAGIVFLMSGIAEMAMLPELVQLAILLVGLALIVYAIYLVKNQHEPSDEMGDEHLQYAGFKAFFVMLMLMLLLGFIPNRLFELVPQLMNIHGWMQILMGIGLLYLLYVFNRLERED